MLRKAENVAVLLGDVQGVDLSARQVRMSDGSSLGYDHVVIAAGVRHSYFGHGDWERDAPGLKTIDDALEMRRRVLPKCWKGGKRGGSGLGLYIVGGLTKVHGGTVTIDDAPAGGARIQVAWPSAVPEL